MIWLVLRTFSVAALYGYALGSVHDHLYASRNVVKFPLLLAVTAVVCAASYWIAALALGARLRFAAVQRAAWGLFCDASSMLASLAPAVLFVALVMRTSDDGQLGEYDLFLFVNVVCIALAGGIALVRRGIVLIPETAGSLRRRLTIVAAWLALSLFVGGQVAFLLRPFVGLPATRGQVPPWFLWNEPDARGATNFYAAVWQTLHGGELVWWAERR